MTSTDLVVFIMCGVMILIGVTIFRVSKRDRGMGAVAAIIGVVGVVAYLTADEDASPPAAATPTVQSGIGAGATPDATPAP